MRSRSIVLLFLSVVLSVISSVTFAQSRANAATFTLGGGYYYFAPKRHINNTGVPLAAIGFDFTDHWGIEGLLSIFKTKSRNNQDDGKQVSGTLFLVDGLYHFTQFHRVEPFVLAGVGIMGLDPNGNDANNEGNINAGAGVNFFMDKSIALRAEARDIYTIVGGKNDVMLDAGITFLLDIC